MSLVHVVGQLAAEPSHTVPAQAGCPEAPADIGPHWPLAGAPSACEQVSQFEPQAASQQ